MDIDQVCTIVIAFASYLDSQPVPLHWHMSQVNGQMTSMDEGGKGEKEKEKVGGIHKILILIYIYI